MTAHPGSSPDSPEPDDEAPVSASAAARGAVRRGRYAYPEAVLAGPRRGRRAAKRAFRRAERAAAAQDAARARDAAGPVRAMVGLAVLIAAAGGAWLFGRAVEQPPRPAPAAAASPTPSPSVPAPAAAAAGLPAASAGAPRTERTGPERVAEEWVRAYLARDPLADQSHAAAVQRASAWAAAALTANLAAYPDPAFDRLVSLGATSQVSAVSVGPATQGLPVDTPLRVWRQTAARLILTNDEGVLEEARTLQVELVAVAGGWLVSRVLGV
jgi:hypothetical protein